MKKNLTIAFFVLIVAGVSQGQDSAYISRGYFGVKSTIFHEDSKTRSKSDLYVAVEGKGSVIGLVVTGRVIYSSKLNNDGFGHLFVTKLFSDHFSGNLGLQAQPISMLKPHPVSEGAHFEPTSVSWIPGAAPGVTLVGKWKNVVMAGGVSIKDKLTVVKFTESSENTRTEKMKSMMIKVNPEVI